jgi:sugar/nucleoside kinase (ribokinase family)
MARQPLADHLTDIARQPRYAGKRISFDPNWRSLMDHSYVEQTFPAMVKLANIIKLSDEDLRQIFPVLAKKRLSKYCETSTQQHKLCSLVVRQEWCYTSAGEHTSNRPSE